MATTWKQRLAAQMPEDWAREIDIYETQIGLRKQGKIEEKLFAETRLRRGSYGQRYDNGQRHDGEATREIPWSRELTKGPDTIWDAPGMQRIKIPYGGMNPDQMEVLADVAEEYSVGVMHVTTRQDFQCHYVHIENAPNLMRRLAAVNITTREACGNSVRNVTACPYAGICRDETFDVSPYARAMMRFMLGHPDTMEFGRKFKIAFSGCAHHACGLTNMHDFAGLALVQDGKRGFRLYVGGGLGPVPHEAKVLEEFVPEEELLPYSQAVSRVFARLGEKKNRARARIKFLVAKLGIEEFRRLVLEEKETMPYDPRWTDYLKDLHATDEEPLKPAHPLNGAPHPDGFDAWYRTNVYQQRQQGYVAVKVTLPLGDISSWQLRQLADVVRTYCGDHIRTTVDQNLLLRWVSESDVVNVYKDLAAMGLNESGAGTIVDVTACPGTDSCKLGISSSRGLAGVLRERLSERNLQLDDTLGGLHIKISGCFNSCGQHHIADLGFYGVNRNVNGRSVPHFQVILGGKWRENAGAYGLAVGAVPSKNIPELVDRMLDRFTRERQEDETFQDFIGRIGKRELKEMVDDLMKVPAYEEDRWHYTDWGDPREYTHGDRGKGECAGEVVTLIEFNMADAEREVFEAQILLDEGKYEDADAMAYKSMLSAARALVKMEYRDVADDPEQLANEFRTRFYDTKLFFDRFVGGRFAEYFLDRHARENGSVDKEGAHRIVEEAQLFIEAAHACSARVDQQRAAAEPAKA